MSGYEKNYDFASLIDCASGLNRLASMEYGAENLRLGKTHAKQQTIWGKFHPFVSGEREPDLADFSGLRTDDEVTAALKKGFQQAQSLLLQLNMAPRTGVRNQTWWKTPWVSEKEMGLFERGSESARDPADVDLEENGPTSTDPETVGDLWELVVPVENPGSEAEEENGLDDLALLDHETRHIMSEILHHVESGEEEPVKFDPMIVYDGHSIYKATLVSQLVGNPTLSKDRLTRIKQSIYFNGVKQRPRVDGVLVCILDIGSDCAVLFDSENATRVVSLKVEHNIRSVWTLDANDRVRVDEFLQFL
ncbi:hypothetical protein R1sor_009658 [Riccia sorocarpa]|uniref:Uncharacterized protein n=1 Tax=Riccia sorocarpa TaxID=122646 RepID=A0ABD3HVR1_9MARC